MALIHCPECNREISDKATVCPGCGYPLDTTPIESDRERLLKEAAEKDKKFIKKAAAVMAVCILIMLLFVYILAQKA